MRQNQIFVLHYTRVRQKSIDVSEQKKHELQKTQRQRDKSPMNQALVHGFTMPSDAILNNQEKRAINAAIACFSEKGLAGTNMEDVAAKAGMARSSLYRYFKDKD